MYDLGAYPCIVFTGNDKHIVHGELYEYLDDDCRQMIKRMEEATGYNEKEVAVDGVRAAVFVFDKKPRNGKLIRTGIWNKN